MGWGDDIMATAWARKAKAENPTARVFIGTEGKRLEWDIVFFGNSNINNPEDAAKTDRPRVFVPHHTGNRPYIMGTQNGCIVYNPEHRPEKGDIFLAASERDWALAAIRNVGLEPGEFLLLEPHVKGTFAGNKAWIWDRWQEVAKRAPAPVLQIGTGNRPLLPGAKFVKTKTIRHAFAILAQARLLVCTDSAMHHAAAALGIPAVVIWGARTNPDILGYPEHRNIWTGTGVGCGAMDQCSHCRDGMRAVTTDMVVKEIEAALG